MLHIQRILKNKYEKKKVVHANGKRQETSNKGTK